MLSRLHSEQMLAISSVNYEQFIEECYAHHNTPNNLYALGKRCRLLMASHPADRGYWWMEDEITQFLQEHGRYIQHLELRTLEFDGIAQLAQFLGRFPNLDTLTIAESDWEGEDFCPEQIRNKAPPLQVLNVTIPEYTGSTVGIAQWLSSGPAPPIATLTWQLEFGIDNEEQSRFFQAIGDRLQELNLIFIRQDECAIYDLNILPDLSGNTTLERFCFEPLPREEMKLCNLVSAMMSRLNSPRLGEIVIRLTFHDIFLTMDWVNFQEVLLDKMRFPGLRSLVFEVNPPPNSYGIAVVEEIIFPKMERLRAQGVQVSVRVKSRA